MEFKALHDSENVVSPSEPHLRSFVPEVSDQEPDPLPVFEDIDPEEQKDRTLSIVFVLIGALTLISGVGYFIKSRIEPTRTDIISELYVSDSDLVSETNPNTESVSVYGSAEQDELVRKYKERLEEQRQITLTEETFAKQSRPVASSSTSTPNYTITETIIRATSTSFGTTTNRIQNLTERATSSALGISFLKDPFWKQTTKGKSIILKDVGPTTKDTIIMTRFRGTSVTTEDPKYGNVTYFYDSVNKVWMRIYHDGDLSVGEKILPEIFVPIQTTKYRKPIFEGTGRYKTLIIAFGFEDFLIVNINGTGYTKILDTFVKEILNI
jgi:hypothetical protein